MRSEAEPPVFVPNSEMSRMLEREVVPRLVRAEPGVLESRASSARNATAISRADLELFLREVRGESEDAAVAVANALLERGVPTEAIYLDLLAPTANALGDMWSADTCDFVEVTVALGRLQRVLRQLSRVFIAAPTPGNDSVGRVLLSCIPGEQHTLGLFMVAEFMIRDGWGVSVGPPLTEADLLDLLRHEWFDVVGFSVTCDSRLSHLQREIRKVRACSRNSGIGIIVGGRVFNDHPELVRRIGADACAADAKAAPETARELIARARVSYQDAEAAGDE
jgi:methanogenic corrinoid protein MtbC1